MKKILEVKHLKVSPINEPRKILVGDVSFDLYPGRTTCIVGESGSGKSLTALSIMKLLSSQLKQTGDIYFEGKNISQLSNVEMRHYRGKSMAMIFQEPMTSLNPVLTVGDQIKEALSVHLDLDNNSLNKKVLSLFKEVGIAADRISSYPDELSGGQRQRIGIARALATNPELIICDEPVSALDVSVQAQVINLMEDLRDEFGISYLFIAHDLSVVHHISKRIGVMYLGNMVEVGEADDVYFNPKHPYSKALLSSVPNPDPKQKGKKRIVLSGDIPNPLNKPSGCSFRTRCPIAQESCSLSIPELIAKENQLVACPLV